MVAVYDSSEAKDLTETVLIRFTVVWDGHSGAHFSPWETTWVPGLLFPWEESGLLGKGRCEIYFSLKPAGAMKSPSPFRGKWSIPLGYRQSW